MQQIAMKKLIQNKKLLVFILFGVITAGAIIYYLNLYLYKSRAAIESSANITMTGTSHDLALGATQSVTVNIQGSSGQIPRRFNL
jgi:hypothetical protein